MLLAAALVGYAGLRATTQGTRSREDFMRNTRRIMKAVRHPVLSAAVLAVMLAGTAGVTLGQGNEDRAGPVVIEKQGSFMVGGTVTTGTNGDTFHGDHAYVQFQIPPNARDLPLVMWHGGGQFSKTWETTPDGRDGYQNIFLRRGFSTYILDQPRRGRAGRSTKGTSIPDGAPGESGLFSTFRLGIWTPPSPAAFFPNAQFPRDPASLDRKSTRLNSSHVAISYAVFCLKKKN